MQIFIEQVLQQSITFFAILDPIGVSAILLSLLHAKTNKEQINNIAYKTTITIVIAFFVVLILGNLILSMFGINLYSLKVIGGIVLILMAIQMLDSSKHTNSLSKEEDEEIKPQDDISIIPMAIPITFGPGMFSTIIILKNESSSLLDISSIIIAFLINAILLYYIFKNSILIKNFLGITGQNIITKLMALIVGAIAVQFIISGTVNLGLLYLK